jgi:hypothetical protein
VDFCCSGKQGSNSWSSIACNHRSGMQPNTAKPHFAPTTHHHQRTAFCPRHAIIGNLIIAVIAQREEGEGGRYTFSMMLYVRFSLESLYSAPFFAVCPFHRRSIVETLHAFTSCPGDTSDHPNLYHWWSTPQRARIRWPIIGQQSRTNGSARARHCSDTCETGCLANVVVHCRTHANFR